jgi:hypothetical protein
MVTHHLIINGTAADGLAGDYAGPRRNLAIAGNQKEYEPGPSNSSGGSGRIAAIARIVDQSPRINNLS